MRNVEKHSHQFYTFKDQHYVKLTQYLYYFKYSKRKLYWKAICIEFNP